MKTCFDNNAFQKSFIFYPMFEIVVEATFCEKTIKMHDKTDSIKIYSFVKKIQQFRK